MTRPCILLADDDRRARQLVGLTLPTDDYSLCYAEDGPDALRVARDVHPSLVLLDHQMPGLSGVEVCQALRSDPETAGMPILMLTGDGGEALRHRALRAGVDEFLTKPFSPLALEQKVRALVGSIGPGARGDDMAPRARADSSRQTSVPVATEAHDLTRAQLMLYAADLNRSVRGLRAAHADLQASYSATIEALASALEIRDAETEGHCQRVTLYAVAAARHMGVTGEALEQIRWGSLLHDIGKIGVPDAILLKPGPLLPDEWALMKRHPELGAKLISHIPALTSALSIVRFHHERFDGTGYPRGLRGTAIPFGARLFAVADALDAMTVDRPYRPALSWDQARAEIVRGRGTQFDPEVADAYLAIFQELHAIATEDGPAT